MEESRTMNMLLRKKMVGLLILLIIILNLIISQERNQQPKEKDLNYYTQQGKAEEFVELNQEERESVWNDEQNSFIKNTVVEEITNHLLLKRWEGDMMLRGARVFGEQFFELIKESLREQGVTSIKGVNIEDILRYNGGLSGFLKDNYGVDIDRDLTEPSIDRIIGFKDLRWSEVKDANGKTKNIIGDGKIWLDLERIPLGTKEIEYNNGKFILRMRKGGEIIISESDEEGDVILKNTGKKTDGETDYITISPMDIYLATENGKGSVELHEKGLTINGDAVVDIKGLQIKNREGVSQGEFFILDDRFVLQGTELELRGIAHINPKDNSPFIVPVGDTRRFLDFVNGELPKTMKLGELKQGIAKFKDVGELLAGRIDLQFSDGKLTGIRINEGKEKGDFQLISEINIDNLDSSDFLKNIIREAKSGRTITYDFLQENLKEINNAALGAVSEQLFKGFDLTELGFLAKEISFEDYVIWEGRESVGQFATQPRTFRDFEKISLRFDENGQLHSIQNQKFGKAWVSVQEGQRTDFGDLKKLYSRSSQTVTDLINRAVKGERVDYSDVSSAFYSSDELKKEGRTLSIDSHHENFAAFIGDNVVVGGKGNVELKKDMNSLTGYEAKDFDVKIGNVDVRFDEKGINLPRGLNEFVNAYEIGDISYVQNGRLGAQSFMISKEDGRYKVDNNKNFVAGRQILLGPLGSSASVYSTIKSDDYAKIIQSENREELIEKTMQSDFEIGVDVYIPIIPKEIGYSPDKETREKIIDETLIPWLDKKYFNEPFENEDLIKLIGHKKLKQGPINSIKSIIRNSLLSIESLEGRRASIGFRNNPKGNPEIVIDVNGKQSIVKLQGNDAVFMRDLLELSARMPDPGRGKTTTPFLGAETSYSSPPYMKQLWRDTFGDKTILLGTGDYQRRLSRIAPGEGFINKFDRLYLENAD